MYNLINADWLTEKVFAVLQIKIVQNISAFYFFIKTIEIQRDVIDWTRK